MRSQPMSNYLELDEQWRQRSEQMFRRCLKESDATKAQRVWDAACQSEQRRLEWKSTYLKQEEKIRIFVAADGSNSAFHVLHLSV